MNLLTFTTLYPNAMQPSHGVFVENRIAHLVASGVVETRVVAPITYVPNVPGLVERHARLRAVPTMEERRGLRVEHPRYFLVPKIGMLAAPLSLYAAAKRRVQAIQDAGYAFDLIDAHYFYPDGVAAILLGRYFNKPVTITARGSDINVLATYRLPRKMIRWAAGEAAGLITVCQALKDSLVGLGVSPSKIRVLRNGVDLATFRPSDRERTRARLGFASTTLICVGNLVPLKSQDLAIQALNLMSDRTARLVIIGEGPEEAGLRALAEQLGLTERVSFLGRLPHQSLPDYYVGADVSLLLSSREGWANVLLEAMACGTPVVASAVGGTPEVVATPAVGELLEQRTPAEIAWAIERLLARKPDRQAIRSYAEGFSWDATTQGQFDLFEEILSSRQQPGPGVVSMGYARQ